MRISLRALSSHGPRCGCQSHTCLRDLSQRDRSLLTLAAAPADDLPAVWEVLELIRCADGKACDPAGDDTFRSGFMAIAQRIMAEAGACPVQEAVDLGCEAAGTLRLCELPYPVVCASPTSV